MSTGIPHPSPRSRNAHGSYIPLLLAVSALLAEDNVRTAEVTEDGSQQHLRLRDHHTAGLFFRRS